MSEHATEIDCICPVAAGYSDDEPQGLCLGVPGETSGCAACLALDPEEPCLHDPERTSGGEA